MKIPTDILEKIWLQLAEFAVDYGWKLIGAAFILVIGLLVIRWVGKTLQRWLDKREMEPPVRTLIVRVVKLILFGFTFVIVLEKVGVPIAPLLAGVGVLGLGIGLAMQGVLTNLMAGLLIIFTKPFRVGEYVELLGVQGVVQNVDLFSTVLTHPDRSRIVIPNRKIIGEILHNCGHMRQLNLSVGVGYGTNLGEAIATVRDTLAANPRVLKSPEPVVGVSVLADSSIVIAVQPWVKVGDHGAAGGELNQAIVEAFRAKRIEIPFPQREVRVFNAGDLDGKAA